MRELLLTTSIAPDGSAVHSPETVPVSGRSAEQLARHYGFDGVAEFVENLPLHANVIDVGAGLSLLGLEVACLRPDINWTNVDLSYQSPELLAELEDAAPPNLTHVAGDAVQLGALLPPGSADACLSYWMLPYLSLRNAEKATTVAAAMYGVTKAGGKIAVGPVLNPWCLSNGCEVGSGDAAWFTKEQGITADVFAEEAVRLTRFYGLVGRLCLAFNQAVSSRFGTGLYERGAGRDRQIYDRQSDVFIPRHSLKGRVIAGRFRLAVIGRFIAPDRS